MRSDPLPCVWMDAGVITYRLCDRDHRCAECPFDRAMRRSPVEEPAALPGPAATAPADLVDGYELPGALFYAPWHVWARVEGGGRVRIGLDDFAQRLLGSVRSVELPRPGSRVGGGERSWRVGHAAGTTAIRIPVTGTVLEANDRLASEPGLLNRDPYGDGAAVVIEPSRLAEGVRRLHWGDVARDWCRAEVSRLRGELALRDAASVAVGPTLQDGGLPAADFASALDPAEHRRLIRAFLLAPIATSKTRLAAPRGPSGAAESGEPLEPRTKR